MATTSAARHDHPLSHNEDDRRVVEAQLGRRPRGQWGVARRCHLGVPMVIENHPRLHDGSPFPTTFWLTCPLLIKRVGTLESRGMLSEVTGLLGADEDLRRRMSNALVRYRARRDSHEVLDDWSSPPGGGPDRVKCLHAHVAHELADPPNPAGAIALEKVGWPDCVVPCVAHGEPA
jgi:hypothetical protein